MNAMPVWIWLKDSEAPTSAPSSCEIPAGLCMMANTAPMKNSPFDNPVKGAATAATIDSQIIAIWKKLTMKSDIVIRNQMLVELSFASTSPDSA